MYSIHSMSSSGMITPNNLRHVVDHVIRPLHYDMYQIELSACLSNSRLESNAWLKIMGPYILCSHHAIKTTVWPVSKPTWLVSASKKNLEIEKLLDDRVGPVRLDRVVRSNPSMPVDWDVRTHHHRLRPCQGLSIGCYVSLDHRHVVRGEVACSPLCSSELLLLPGQPPDASTSHKVTCDGHAPRHRTNPDRVQVIWCPVPPKPPPGLTGGLVVGRGPELHRRNSPIHSQQLGLLDQGCGRWGQMRSKLWGCLECCNPRFKKERFNDDNLIAEFQNWWRKC